WEFLAGAFYSHISRKKTGNARTDVRTSIFACVDVRTSVNDISATCAKTSERTVDERARSGCLASSPRRVFNPLDRSREAQREDPNYEISFAQLGTRCRDVYGCVCCNSIARPGHRFDLVLGSVGPCECARGTQQGFREENRQQDALRVRALDELCRPLSER